MTLTLKDVLTMMVVVSDNTATNLAIDRFGIEAINSRIGWMGLKGTHLYKRIGKPATAPMPADQPRFGLGKTTPREDCGRDGAYRQVHACGARGAGFAG